MHFVFTTPNFRTTRNDKRGTRWSLSSFADYRPALPARGVSAAFSSRCLRETRRYTRAGWSTPRSLCAAAPGHSLGARPLGTLGFTPTGAPDPIPAAPAARFFIRHLFFLPLLQIFSLT